MWHSRCVRLCDIRRSGGGALRSVRSQFLIAKSFYGYEHLIALRRQGHRVAYYARGMVQIFRRSNESMSVDFVWLFRFFFCFKFWVAWNQVNNISDDDDDCIKVSIFYIQSLVYVCTESLIDVSRLKSLI